MKLLRFSKQNVGSRDRFCFPFLNLTGTARRTNFDYFFYVTGNKKPNKNVITTCFLLA